MLTLQKARIAEAESARAQAEKQNTEAERRRAAEENKEAKQRSDTQTRRNSAFQEAIWLYRLDEEEGRTIDPDGVFRHRNGFEFSNKALQEGIEHLTRVAAARTLFNQQLNHIKSKTLMSSTSPFVPKTWQDPEEDRLERVA